MPRNNKPTSASARDYRHDQQQALSRPEGGAQEVFPSAKKKPRKTYRYDSSLAPELTWDEAEVRGAGEELIEQILNSDDLPQAHRAAEKLKRLSQPFLNWGGKAERGSIRVPTLPLFVHERLSTSAVLETQTSVYLLSDNKQIEALIEEGDKLGWLWRQGFLEQSGSTAASQND